MASENEEKGVRKKEQKSKRERKNGGCV